MRVSDLSPGSVEPLFRGRLGRPYRFVAECASTQRLLDGEEIAAAAGMPVGTAKCHAHRGRNRLREQLEQRDVA